MRQKEQHQLLSLYLSSSLSSLLSPSSSVSSSTSFVVDEGGIVIKWSGIVQQYTTLIHCIYLTVVIITLRQAYTPHLANTFVAWFKTIQFTWYVYVHYLVVLWQKGVRQKNCLRGNRSLCSVSYGHHGQRDHDSAVIRFLDYAIDRWLLQEQARTQGI